MASFQRFVAPFVVMAADVALKRIRNSRFAKAGKFTDGKLRVPIWRRALQLLAEFISGIIKDVPIYGDFRAGGIGDRTLENFNYVR